MRRGWGGGDDDDGDDEGGGGGEAVPRAGSVTWLVEPPPPPAAAAESVSSNGTGSGGGVGDRSPSTPLPPIMLMAHPGVKTTLREALQGAGLGAGVGAGPVAGTGAGAGAVFGEGAGSGAVSTGDTDDTSDTDVDYCGTGVAPRRVVISVGPEGGWTEYERGVMQAAGFIECALGPRTFTTDVACIALVAAVRERTESW